MSLDVSLSAATGLIDRIEERGSSNGSASHRSSDRLVRITAAGRQLLRDVEVAPDRDHAATSSTSSIRRSSRGSPARWPTSARRLARDPIARRNQPPTHVPREGMTKRMEAFPGARRRLHTVARGGSRTRTEHREKMEILFAVMLGLFLGALDQTIVGPALPTIVTQLSATTTTSGPSRSTCSRARSASRSGASCPTSTAASRSS
jgi:DNA-binding MarR family transcriptional regulator